MTQFLNDWQEWVVVLLLLYCALRILLYIRSFFPSDKIKSNPCESCLTGCDLKRLYDEKRMKCGEEKQKQKKSCCK